MPLSPGSELDDRTISRENCMGSFYEDYPSSDLDSQNWNMLDSFTSRYHDIDMFLREKKSLDEIELEQLGEVQGLSILHLQCHFGMSTIHLEQKGASVLGVDYSREAIENANHLKRKYHSNVEFMRCDLGKTPEMVARKFDMVFASYGILNRLSDLNEWAKIISALLKPDGEFVFIEFHPIVWMFDQSFIRIAHKYDDPDPIIETVGTYVDSAVDETKRMCLGWNHGLASVLNSLIRSKIRIEEVREYDFCPCNISKVANEVEIGRFQVENGNVPLVYTIRGKKMVGL